MGNTKDLQAVATITNRDLVFFLASDGSINYYESQSPKEADLRPYKEEQIQMDAEAVIADVTSGLVTAVAYRDPATGNDEVRVYYVAQNTRKIRELARTNGGEWKNGKGFNDIGAVVAENGAMLTANVAFGQLKVYFQSRDQAQGKVSLLYANLGAGNWTPKSKIN